MVYPGLVPLVLNRIFAENIGEDSKNASPILSLRPGTLPRSRVCEQVWLDGELFNQADAHIVYATTEEDYRQLASTGLNGARANPASLFGRFGEQLVLREVRQSAFIPGAQFKVADVLLECAGSSTCSVKDTPGSATRDQAIIMTIYAFRIIEPGLVEPGAAITGIG